MLIEHPLTVRIAASGCVMPPPHDAACTAPGVRTTGPWLTWRLWTAGSGDAESPRITVEDDLETEYRAGTGTTSWSDVDDRITADGPTFIVPTIAAGARTLTVRLEGFEVAPLERRFPGARARELHAALEFRRRAARLTRITRRRPRASVAASRW